MLELLHELLYGAAITAVYSYLGEGRIAEEEEGRLAFVIIIEMSMGRLGA